MMAKQAIRDVATAAVASLVAGALGAALTGGNDKTRQIYATEKNPPFAPPGWVFGAAWTLNNALLAYTGLQAARSKKSPSARRATLALLGAHTALFYAWPTAFVRMRSPMLGAAVTFADLGVNAVGAYQASRIDKRYALGYATTVAWLGLASALAGYIALKNDDPFFGVHREGNTRKEMERIDAEMLRQQELGDRSIDTHYHGEDKTVADTFPASDPIQTP